MTIEDFLIECKRRVKNNNLDYVPTRKNNETRRRLGLTILDIEDEIISLSSSDLYTGPEIDRDIYTEVLWIFKRVIRGKTVYIKLKLRTKTDEVVCISFHEDE